jgi:flagellar motor switch/type III secretory pathway protein FliN
MPISTQPWCPYRLLGASGRSRLQQKLEAAARRWLEAWNPGGVSVSVRIGTPDERLPVPRDPFTTTHRVRTEAGTALDVRLHPRALGSIFGVPAERFFSRVAASDDDTLDARLSLAILRGLAGELMDSASIGEWSFEDHDAREDADTATKLAGQRALFSVADREVVTLELAPLLVNALVPAGAAESDGGLEPCRDAIGDARLSIEAVLGGVDLSVADFLSLNRGDVIVLESRLGDCCRVEIPAVGAVAQAVVGRLGSVRAVWVRDTEQGSRG